LFSREFPGSSFDVPKKLKDNDVVLRYSTLGFLPVEGKQIALCWELYPDMKQLFCSNQWDNTLAKVYECSRYSTYRTVATEHTIPNYQAYGSVDVFPIGVNTDLFKPLDRTSELRKKYNLPSNKTIGVWIGTNHRMKGYDILLRYASEHPDIHWILIWKWEMEESPMVGASNFTCVPQEQICELTNSADFFLSTSRLAPYYMAEWEAMACNVPFVYPDGASSREFYVSENPRDDVFKMGWDRISVKSLWEKYLTERGAAW
jgi:glycosyltransferase involved in cell wall biosynthesis